jgi:acetyl esterase/lipase
MANEELECPLDWSPNALAPVFWGLRTYDESHGAPVPTRVYFPSVTGSPESNSESILTGCGRYPVVLFAHGDCHEDQDHFAKWIQLPAQLARSGCVVIVPQLPSITTNPSVPSHPAVAAIADSFTWLLETWELRDNLMTEAPGIAGHSFGGLLAARYAAENQVAGYVGLSAAWDDWAEGELPIIGLSAPKLLVKGGGEDWHARLPESVWNGLRGAKHRAVFAEGRHFDYLPAGQTPCDEDRGPCHLLALAAADLVTMFFAKYLPPEMSPDLPAKIPDDLIPPDLVLTPEQAFYAGSYLEGMRNVEGVAGCKVELVGP